MTVIINGETKLVLKQTKGKVNLFAEVYYGWETGNVFEAPSTATPAEVAELFKA